MKPLQIKKDRFIDWYMSDEVDKYLVGCSVLDNLKRNGSFSLTLEELFLNLDHYPEYLFEPFEGPVEGRDIQLIE